MKLMRKFLVEQNKEDATRFVLAVNKISCVSLIESSIDKTRANDGYCFSGETTSLNFFPLASFENSDGFITVHSP